MKKLSALAVCAILVISMLCGTVSVFASEAKNGISTIKELDGRTIGVQTGVLYEDLIKDQMEGEEWLYYKMPNDMIPALETGKIDAYLIEEVGYYAQKYV